MWSFTSFPENADFAAMIMLFHINKEATNFGRSLLPTAAERE